MKILQGGVPKCGNFWLYQIIQQILIRSGNSNRSFIEQQPIFNNAKDWDLNYPEQARIDVLDITDLQTAYRISSIFKMPVDNLGEYVAKSHHVWTHSPICKRSELVFQYFGKKIYIIRDPRDRAISAAKYFCSPYMKKYFPQIETNPHVFLETNFENLMYEWVWHVFDHLRYSKNHNIYIVFYENLLLDFQNELDGLLEYLELSLEKTEKIKLQDAVSFKNLKQNNPKHLNKGISGYWMEDFTDLQTAKAHLLAGPLINYLGYPYQKGELYHKMKIPDIQDFEVLKNQIVQAH